MDALSPPSGTSYEFDEHLQVSATALPGYEFTGWSGPGAGNLENAALATTRIINPTYGNTDITATFAKTTYTLTYTVNGSGTVNPVSPKTYVYDDGLGITATPDPGRNLSTGPVILVTWWTPPALARSLNNPLTANTDLTANFALIDYTLTVTSVGGTGAATDRVSVSASGPYHYGDVVTLTANPQAGETFASWGGDLAGSTNPETITIDANKTVTANFDFIEYTLTVTSSGGTGGATDRVTVSPSGTHHYGDVVSLTANPQAGETFFGWSGDLAGSANPETITIDANKTVTATFEKIPVTLTMQVVINDSGAFGTVSPVIGTYSYLYGDTVAVSATPNPNSELEGWSGNVVGGTVTMNGDQTVIATFGLKKFNVTFTAGAHGQVQEGSRYAGQQHFPTGQMGNEHHGRVGNSERALSLP